MGNGKFEEIDLNLEAIRLSQDKDKIKELLIELEECKKTNREYEQA